MDASIQRICRDGLLYSQSSRHNAALHQHGLCLATEDLKYQFVRIPKNITSWTKTFFHRHLCWHDDNFNRIKNATALVCLRDPVSRWISGMAEYINLSRPSFDLNKSDSLLLDWILDAMVFDSHTVPQTAFLDGLIYEDVVWFWADADYEKNFTSYLSVQKLLPEGFVKADEEVYEFDNDHRKHKLKAVNYYFLQNLCQKNSDVRARIMEFYRFDYELIHSVNFYSAETSS